MPKKTTAIPKKNAGKPIKYCKICNRKDLDLKHICGPCQLRLSKLCRGEKSFADRLLADLMMAPSSEKRIRIVDRLRKGPKKNDDALVDLKAKIKQIRLDKNSLK